MPAAVPGRQMDMDTLAESGSPAVQWGPKFYHASLLALQNLQVSQGDNL